MATDRPGTRSATRLIVDLLRDKPGPGASLSARSAWHTAKAEVFRQIADLSDSPEQAQEARRLAVTSQETATVLRLAAQQNEQMPTVHQLLTTHANGDCENGEHT